MTRAAILQTALATRDEEVLGYQINIDNFRLALAKIAAEHAGNSDMDVAMRAFALDLQERLRTSLIEQRKAQIIRDVIAQQLEGAA